MNYKDESICKNCVYHSLYVKNAPPAGYQANFGDRGLHENEHIIVGHFCQKGLYGDKPIEGRAHNSNDIYPPQVTQCSEYKIKTENHTKNQLND